MAVRLVEEGNPNLRGDAITAILLAEAGTRAAVTLVETNLSAVAEDARLGKAQDLVKAVKGARNVVEGES